MTESAGFVVWSGYTVVCLGADGWIDGERHGFYHFDTRLLSRYRLSIDGRSPELVTAAQPEADRWEAALRVPRQGGDAEGPILPQDALVILVHRRVGRGMIEEITFHNRSGAAFEASIALSIEAEFADVAEVGAARRQRGRIERSWDPEGRALVFDYSVAHEDRRSRRGIGVRIVRSSSEPALAAEGLAFQLHLEPGAEAGLTLGFGPRVQDGLEDPTLAYEEVSRQRRSWGARRPSLEAAHPLPAVFDRAALDLFDLRNQELEGELLGSTRGGAWVVNAGVPMFTGFFGRDALTSGWQSMLVGQRAARGALTVAAATQAQADDPWRDAEPGKMIHEMRRGPLSELGLSPRDRYYGTQTTTAFFVVTLSELWHWTGDTWLLEGHRDAALRGLEWAERYGDADGDGFLEYRRRSPQGLRNQGWKDSDEAIRYPDGRLVKEPVATVEEQAFHFIALQRMAEILVALGEPERAERFLRRAEDLRRAWHEAFWMPDERFYAVALDGDKQQVRSITSNPGHALGTGIVPPEHARDVADRLLSDELFSGWGVRTLSSRHPSFNPFAYHLGAVWPVEQATFALGFKRYGLDQHADSLIGAVLDAAARCPDQRLPEALSGHARAELSRPIFYPDANSPQAWSSSAAIQLVQLMLGIYPFAPLNVLALLRPRLPEWLPQVTIRGVRVGRASVDLTFTRRDDGSAGHRVLRRRGPLLVMTVPPPQPIDGAEPRWFEQLKTAALERAPGTLTKAARIGLGWTDGAIDERSG
jgi:glycogen debranching enzyme